MVAFRGCVSSIATLEVVGKLRKEHEVVAGGIHVISIGIGVYVVVSSVAGAGGALDVVGAGGALDVVGAGGALDVVGAGGGEWIAGAGGCCCREVERWKDDENGYHGNELHKLCFSHTKLLLCK